MTATPDATTPNSPSSPNELEHLFTPPSANEAQAAQQYLAAARLRCEEGTEWPDEPSTAQPGGAIPPVTTLAVLGAGTMGTGITQCALAAGLRVTLIDRSSTALARAQDRIDASLERLQLRGELTEATLGERRARLTTTLADAWFSAKTPHAVDAVVEAVDENLSLKQTLMARLVSVCAPHTLLVSNTSTLDIDAVAASIRDHADRVIGMHFLTPAHLTTVLEIIPGGSTSRRSLACARALARQLGKLPVWAGNAWGFIGNRIYEAYLREVDALQLQGVPAHRIDQALERFGFVMGPCRQLDMAGTDLVSQVISARGQRYPQDPSYRRITLCLNERGRYGQKSGLGHYRYVGRKPEIDPELSTLCAQEAARLGIVQAPNVSDAAIVQRCVQPLVEEGHQLLAEGVAHRASDIDLVWVLGYGFPAHRGGPMYWGRQA